MAFTFFAKRAIRRAAVFLWITFLADAFWIAGMACRRASFAAWGFFSSTALITFLAYVFSSDFAAVFRSRFLSL